MATKVYFNPWDEAFRANPYPHYRALSGQPPHLINMFFPAALIGRYADAVAILRDPERFSSDTRTMDRIEVFGDAPRLLFSDPPTHTRLRKLVSRAFTPKRIKDLEPKIREFTAALLDRAVAKGELELMADLAVPLPVMVIAEMLGVPPADYERFKEWSDQIIEADNTMPGVPLPPSVSAAFQALRAFFIGEIAERRKNPGPDLVSALVAARDEADAPIGGVEIKAASAVFVVLAAINRDPAQFPDPERFDITRDPNDHLAFGDGIHFCLGAALARLEAMIVFGAMLERFPQLRLADPAADVKYKGSYFLRGLAALRLAIA